MGISVLISIKTGSGCDLFFKNWAENRFFKDLNFGNLQHALNNVQEAIASYLKIKSQETVEERFSHKGNDGNRYHICRWESGNYLNKSNVTFVARGYDKNNNGVSYLKVIRAAGGFKILSYSNEAKYGRDKYCQGFVFKQEKLGFLVDDVRKRYDIIQEKYGLFNRLVCNIIRCIYFKDCPISGEEKLKEVVNVLNNALVLFKTSFEMLS